jgi:predicted outer membrane protein
MGRRLVMRVLLPASILLCAFQTWATGQTRNANDPRSFLERAVETNRFQIQLAELGRTKSQDNRVTQIADSTVRNATQALERLDTAALATARDATLLASEHQQTLEHLSLLSAMEFDREFVDVMTSEHRRGVRLMEQEAGIRTEHQTKLRNTAPLRPGPTADVARDLLPASRQQLAQSEEIQRELQRDAGSALLTR